MYKETPLNGKAPIIVRLKNHYHVKTRVLLARKLGVALGTYDNWMARNRIPEAHLLRIAEEENLNWKWLMTGLGEKFRSSEEEHDER